MYVRYGRAQVRLHNRDGLHGSESEGKKRVQENGRVASLVRSAQQQRATANRPVRGRHRPRQ